jgi:hypothetical protein
MPFSILRARVGEVSAIRLADLQRAFATRNSTRSNAKRSAAGNRSGERVAVYREVVMHPHPQLTPDENRSIRNWSFTMAIVYALFMLAFFASVIVTPSPATPDTNRAAFHTTQSYDEHQPSTDTTTQR